MAEIRINATGGVKLYDADDSHYAQIVAGTITSNVDAITLGHNIATFNAAVTAGGVLKTDDTTEATSTTDGSLQTDGGLSVAKDTVMGDDLKLLSDSSVIAFGADGDTTLTHTDGTGLTLNSTNKLTFGDAASFIQQSSDGVLRIDGEATVDINASAAITLAATTIPVTVGGIPFYADTSNNSIYTHNVSGTDSTAAGNTAYGLTALDAVTTGDKNTCIGYGAGGSLTTAEGCTHVGYNAGASHSTSTSNTFIGMNCGEDCTGDNHVAIGKDTYLDATTEDGNIAIGNGALGGAVNGAENNVIIGHSAGDAITSADSCVFVGKSAGGAMTTGGNSTYVGLNAGSNTTDGHSNVLVGANCATAATDTESAIGLGTDVAPASNDFSFGKSGNIVTNDFDADATWTRSSDVRKKRNIHSQELGLDFINDLRTVRFQWKPSNEFPKEWQDYREENSMDLDVIMHGFIAQEVKEALDKHAINNDKEFSGWKEGDDGMQHTSREMFVIPLIKAMQELSAQVATLQDEIKTLKGE